MERRDTPCVRYRAVRENAFDQLESKHHVGTGTVGIDDAL